MFALCIESSHGRGMGHFFRALNLVSALRRAGQACKVLINSHEPALRMLEQAQIEHVTVDLEDLDSDWEGRFVEGEGAHVWINDRLDTNAIHAAHVKRRNIPLVTFDDRGNGAALADLNVAALAFEPEEALAGRRVLRGIEYLILNPEIMRYRRVRAEGNRLLVTMGGSDTHGVTVKVAYVLKRAGRGATIVLGPGFSHYAELAGEIGPGLRIKEGVSSLVAEFARYDFAITGGGITPFEANASGLPCIVIANEPWEVSPARELARLGGSVFAGHHSELDEGILVSALPLHAMSLAGIAHIGLRGADRVVRELMSL